MSDIRTLLARLSAGEITVAEDLWAELADDGNHEEAADLRRLVGRLLAAWHGRSRDDLPGIWDEFRRDLSATFWPWLKDGSPLLACERDCVRLQQQASIQTPASSRRHVFVHPVGEFD